MRKYQLQLNGKDFTVHLRSLSAEQALLEINGEEYSVGIAAVTEVLPDGDLSLGGPSPVTAPAAARKPSAGGEGAVTAPIAGSVMEVYVKVGDTIKAGQPLFKMEAMKMENEINARIDGTIAAVNINSGDSIGQGDEVIVITP